MSAWTVNDDGLFVYNFHLTVHISQNVKQIASNGSFTDCKLNVNKGDYENKTLQ